MRRKQQARCGRLPVLFLGLLVFLLPGSIAAQVDPETSSPADVAAKHSLLVEEFALGHGYDREARAPLDTATVFAADVERIYCYTRIVGAEIPTQITHAWYHEGENRAKVRLAVGLPSWRTFSYKTILPIWTGRWEVKVLDAEDNVLATRKFTIQ
ncbi:MAG: DUF2914 domain-containing protein [bacterium]